MLASYYDSDSGVQVIFVAGIYSGMTDAYNTLFGIDLSSYVLALLSFCFAQTPRWELLLSKSMVKKLWIIFSISQTLLWALQRMYKLGLTLHLQDIQGSYIIFVCF